MGSYKRREEEWIYQRDMADKEQEQIEKQIAAAEIRLAIAEKDQKNHELQIENTKEVDAYMRSKFTNKELYNWDISHLSPLYFQTYQMAYDLAKRAERAYQDELGIPDKDFTPFIQFGYWDSLKKGLLAGEKLHYDLKRMEVAYLEQSRREYEITKHVSLAMLDPIALLQLKQTGECFLSLPEALFDLDYPGQYMRRIKSVSLTIPCVTGPYTSVSCTLTLLKSSIRTDTSLPSDNYARNRQNPDDRLKDLLGAVQSIVTSSAQNDSGLFELNLRDERYLPFEGAGVISDWHLELSGKWRGSSGKAVEFPQFDFNTISDVILHLRYTAREGGDLLKQKAVEKLQEALDNIVLTEGRKGLFRLFSMRHEFSGEWHRFLHPANTTADHQALTLKLTKEHFPFQFQAKQITINKIEIFVKVENKWAASNDVSKLKLSLEVGKAPSFNALNLQSWNGLFRAEKNESAQLNTSSPTITWTLTAWLAADGNTRTQLGAEALEEIAVLCHYSVSEPG